MSEQQETNTFALSSDQYALARPRYPQALFSWLAEHVQTRHQAWDCATGNGQAALDLASYFALVQATDVSQEQIANALPAVNISYSVAPAERSSFADQSFDLITVAQALHWFDYDQFWPEVGRVAKPGALFCAWGYAWFDTDTDVMENLVHPVRELIAPFWAPNNRLLWDGYQDSDIAFPFARIPTPTLQIEERWNVAQIIQYLQTWSAFKKATQVATTAAQLQQILELAHRQFPAHRSFQLTMPLTIVAARL